MPARQSLRAYVGSIVHDEWPLLPHGKASDRTEVELYKLFAAVGDIHPADNRQTTIFGGIFTNLNELVGLRRDRLIHSNSGMPIILWVVALFGSILIVSYTATFRYNRTNVIMISGISLALGLVFLFILVVDRPFMGDFSVPQFRAVGPDRQVRPRRPAESGPDSSGALGFRLRVPPSAPIDAPRRVHHPGQRREEQQRTDQQRECLEAEQDVEHGIEPDQQPTDHVAAPPTAQHRG
jgi:hypothetical protein